MSLNHKQIRTLIDQLTEPADRDMNCEEFASVLAALGEQVVQGQSIESVSLAVRDHLAACPECSEDLEMFVEVSLETEGDPSS